MSLVKLYFEDGRPILVEPEWVNEWVNDKGFLREPPVEKQDNPPDDPPPDPDPDPDSGEQDGPTDPEPEQQDEATDGDDDGQDDAGEADEDPIEAAIRQLDPDNPMHWTQAGKPQVYALEEILGYQISAAQRDAAWEVVQADSGGA